MKNFNGKLLGFLFILFLAIGCEGDESPLSGVPQPPEEIDLSDSFYYEINLKDRSDDTFKVRMFVDDLTDANKVFQFPATVPGVYRTFNIGQFVVSFKAFDENLNALGATKLSTNQWELSNAAATRIIEFEVKETFDTPSAAGNQIYRMSGTSLENDHTLLNAFDVLGYPTGLKERDFYLSLRYPAEWKVSTSLQKTESGLYYADDYDKFVDSPILLGDITIASFEVDDTRIQVNTYSEADLISSGQVLNDVEEVINDANMFLKGLPVDNYNFLFFFHNVPFDEGALEHSYSSVHVFKDREYPYIDVRGIVAHEFFHIVTPLNIHSEIIEDFNFVTPTASQHLWFYEGVTEWASLMMRYRNGSIYTPDLLNQFSSKKRRSDSFYLSTMSLTTMSLTSYTSGASQFGNVYQKGALVAALLDIRLLELSDGQKGLRELILDLVEIYGPDNAFSEADFFDVLVEKTHPQIEDFIERYIKGIDDLPLQEYFAKVGVNYVAATKTFTEISAKSPEQQSLFNKWKVNL